MDEQRTANESDASRERWEDILYWHFRQPRARELGPFRVAGVGSPMFDTRSPGLT